MIILYDNGEPPMIHCEITMAATHPQLRGSGHSFLFRLFGYPNAMKYRGSRLPNHYVMCRAASSGAGDSAESCWGEFLLIILFYITVQTCV